MVQATTYTLDIHVARHALSARVFCYSLLLNVHDFHGNAKSLRVKNDTKRTLQQMFIFLRPPPLLDVCFEVVKQLSRFLNLVTYRV
jgi:hypothetical protein